MRGVLGPVSAEEVKCVQLTDLILLYDLSFITFYESVCAAGGKSC